MKFTVRSIKSIMINFETLFDQVPASPGDVDHHPMTKEEYGIQLNFVIADAKRDGVSIYDVLEQSFLQLKAEGKSATVSQAEEAYRERLVEAGGNPDRAVTDAEVAEYDLPTLDVVEDEDDSESV
jgi:hypothetical protein